MPSTDDSRVNPFQRRDSIKRTPPSTPVIKKPEQDKNMTMPMPGSGHQKKRKADGSPDVKHMDEIQPSGALCKMEIKLKNWLNSTGKTKTYIDRLKV